MSERSVLDDLTHKSAGGSARAQTCIEAQPVDHDSQSGEVVLDHTAEEANRGLTRVTEQLRTDILKFRDELRQLSPTSNLPLDSELPPTPASPDSASDLIRLTNSLADQLAHRYDEIRRETELVVASTGIRVDPLTGLANRRAVEEWMHFLFSMAARYDTRFSVAIFDFDGFTKLSAEQGEPRINELLVEMAQILRGGLRDSDIVARYGRDEFLVLLLETDLKGAAIVSHRLRDQVVERLGCTVSVGLTHVECADSQRILMNRADSALYGAKAGGGNLVYQHNGVRIECVQPTEAAGSLVV